MAIPRGPAFRCNEFAIRSHYFAQTVNRNLDGAWKDHAFETSPSMA
jgi:hypothetical protein